MYKEPKSEVTNMTPMNIVCASTKSGGNLSEQETPTGGFEGF